MGCQQSKAIRLDSGHGGGGATNKSGLRTVDTSPISPMSNAASPRSGSQSLSLPKEINKISDPGQRLFTLLQMTLQNSLQNKLLLDSNANANANANANNNAYDNDHLIWAKVIKICEKHPNSAGYQHPPSGDTPLHLACRLLALVPYDDSHQNLNMAPLDAIRMFIRCSADIASRTNKKGYIALHDAICPPSSNANANAHANANANAYSAAIQHQTQVINLLIAADYESSLEYLQRTDIIHNKHDGAGTPIYHAVASLPDDFTSPPGSTTQFISAIHFPCPMMVSAKNDSNHDKPLALLYRRFSRQFDQSEKFFPGDNSRREVLDHRNRYKTAAMNSWKIILALLDPMLDKRKAMSDFYMVHAAVRIDCPPDLLRYIIETRPEEVRQTNEVGRLPLHVAADAKIMQMQSSRDMSTSASASIGNSASRYHYKFVIDELLYSYPDGAASVDADNMLPLQLAVNSGKTWIGGGTKSLYDVYPDAMARVSVEEFPTIKSALSFSTNYAGEREEGQPSASSGDDAGLNGIIKEEHYDAIMMVQKRDADLGDVISAMWANEEDGGVQMLGCAAIADMAKKIKTNDPRLRSMALTAVTTVVNAMKNHPNEPAVQEKACGALRLLAPADNYREVSFAASGAAASIVGAMQAHVSDAIVQREACSALRDIVKFGGPDRATVIASVSGFTALQNSLGAHPNNVHVQREACLTLEALTAIQSANLPDLPGIQTAPLLNAARERFPDECKEVAEIVLSRLS